ncbi:EGF-like domain protein [Ancylostoma duodenale]|uniref:EGF-like domain protein n=1 Tax=Ancylostoma duodenale TaxID=51022 RepID=A0A0C2GFN9_9BILA|nr:EGF-like domain protein [Ancylostoma duodenale]
MAGVRVVSFGVGGSARDSANHRLVPRPPQGTMLYSNPALDWLFRYNECADPKDNDCDDNADCIDTDDSYICQCRPGFFDENTDPQKTGRVCIELGLVIDRPQETEKTTLSPNLVPCGNTHCRVDLHEVCIGGSKCGCRPGEARSSPEEKCMAVTEVPIVVRVIDFDGEPLQYSTDYSRPNSPEHVQIVDTAVKGLGDVFSHTDVAPRYVTTDVNFITNPKSRYSDSCSATKLFVEFFMFSAISAAIAVLL